MLDNYKQLTTSWLDLSIADRFGISAIKSTYKSLLKNFNGNYKYITELVVVLNHKIWQYYDKNNNQYMKVYNDLWDELCAHVYKTFKKDELSYFYRITD